VEISVDFGDNDTRSERFIASDARAECFHRRDQSFAVPAPGCVELDEREFGSVDVLVEGVGVCLWRKGLGLELFEKRKTKRLRAMNAIVLMEEA